MITSAPRTISLVFHLRLAKKSRADGSAEVVSLSEEESKRQSIHPLRSQRYSLIACYPSTRRGTPLA